MEKILVVAQAPEVHAEIRRIFEASYQLQFATSAKQARLIVEEAFGGFYDLLLIGWSIPDSGCLEFCTWARTHEATFLTPIFLIDHSLGDLSRSKAFAAGANDLVRMPFQTDEFLAQAQSIVRFRKSIAKCNRTSARGPFLIDLEAQRVLLKNEGLVVDVDLTPIEFKMFVLFTNHEGRPLSREQIRSTIWGDTVHIESRSIDKHVSSLRRKLAPFEECIQTTPGLGYSFRPAEATPRKSTDI